LKILKQNPDAAMIVAPSDHWIEDEKAFAEDVLTCLKKCGQAEVLCTLGIRPTFPNTGFGYIEYDKEGDDHLKKVAQFTEKPDYSTAKKFLEKGNFLWNAGIFMWSAEAIVNAFKNYQPGQYAMFYEGMPFYNTDDEEGFIKENYHRAVNISIDYAILEQSDSIFVLPASFDWNDLGTWGSLYEKLEKDDDNNAIVNGRMLAEKARGNMIRMPKGKLAVIEGLEDYIIVDKKEVLLIFPKSKEQDIKEVLQKVKEKFGDQYS
jgi:mannose-1-phosphate guanylyltransferase